MRIKMLLALMGFSVLALLGSQLVSPLGRAFTINAIVNITPNTLNLNRQGNWITVHIALPSGYNASDIDTSTILLQDLFRPEWSNMEGDVLMTKFDAQSLIDYLWSVLYHMGGNRVRIELTVEGQLTNGTSFSGSDTITIMNPLDA